MCLTVNLPPLTWEVILVKALLHRSSSSVVLLLVQLLRSTACTSRWSQWAASLGEVKIVITGFYVQYLQTEGIFSNENSFGDFPGCSEQTFLKYITIKSWEKLGWKVAAYHGSSRNVFIGCLHVCGSMMYFIPSRRVDVSGEGGLLVGTWVAVAQELLVSCWVRPHLLFHPVLWHSTGIYDSLWK